MPNLPGDGENAVPMNAIRMFLRQRADVFARIRLFALAAVLSAVAALPAHAETGTVRFKFFKAGWFVGAQAGSGILVFRDEIYPFRIGGISGGLTFGGSSTDLVGTARNMHQPSDIEGVYTALGAGIAIVGGARAIQMTNAKGVVLTLEGKQLGVAFDFDLSGMSVSIQKQ
jgi:lipid-binding SYLF domain-containing protein